MKGAVEGGGHFWPLRALYHVESGLNRITGKSNLHKYPYIAA